MRYILQIEFLIALAIFGSTATLAVACDTTPAHMEIELIVQ